MGPSGPFLPKSTEAKRGQGGIPLAHKPQVGPPEPFLAPNPNQPKMAKNHLRTRIGQEPQNGHKSVHDLWKTLGATRSAPSKDSPPVKGKTSPSSMHPVLKDPGVVHIWYNRPLCTILLSNPMVTLSGSN
ncbi:hypothetical protein O181_039817 [Austropuccinia psidii MF-1]|uniref:Uncharacterized protein n=1 Tax=Austropuccinia psidii MF-1 TaxID=1389203 RepID=A0A9Q3DHJ3_9BASI|nr:hypothetical protein [Austropuccinia psidii MF-1]